MAAELDDKNVQRAFREEFLGILMHDVLLAIQRRNLDDTQATRRDLIRTMFAAIEGASWEYREHVRSVATDLESLHLWSNSPFPKRPIASLKMERLTSKFAIFRYQR